MLVDVANIKLSLQIFQHSQENYLKVGLFVRNTTIHTVYASVMLIGAAPKARLGAPCLHSSPVDCILVLCDL